MGGRSPGWVAAGVALREPGPGGPNGWRPACAAGTEPAPRAVGRARWSTAARGLLATSAPPLVSFYDHSSYLIVGRVFVQFSVCGTGLCGSFAVPGGLQSQMATRQTANEGNIYDGQS